MKRTSAPTVDDRIKTAFIGCLKEKMKIEEITVMTVCERAGVSKSTFYRHYKDIYDIFEQLVEDFMKRIEQLIVRLFFEKSITMKEITFILMKSGLKKDNELFYARDAVLIDYSIELGNSEVIEILYDKAYDYVFRIAKRIGVDDESAAFGATFFLNGNIIPIILNVHTEKRIDLKTVMLTIELFEMEVEKWKRNQ
ncbi:MAG: TetR/AcrR family transcriptional regulator [Ruminococcaceae bacterium]|nr:TetR/AcrR family transcriptional regulator [Oscillospiraceae bacterium]